jgi:hypothetical protein
MADEALLDAPEVDVVDTDVQVDDSGVDSDATDDSTQVDNDVQTQDDTAPVISDANGQLKLSEKARAELDRIKLENPKLAREMRAALFDRQTLLAKVPGGVKEALATIEAYEAEGGSEAVQQVKAELGQWKDLDADFQAGKPEFVKDIANGNPEAFIKIAPMVLSEFSSRAPDHFAHEVSKVFAGDMAAAEIPMHLKLLRREIEDPQNPGKTKPGLEGVTEVYNALQSYMDRINGLAKNAPKTEAKAPTVAAGSELEQREQALTVREFTSERARVKESITEQEFTKNLGTRKLSSEKVSTIQELYETALDRMVKSIPGHTAKVDRFLAAKDKAGYSKHMAAAIRSKAPEAMAQAFRKAGAGTKPGPLAKPAAKPGAPAVKTAPTTGFTRIGTKPNHNEVNWTETARIPGKKGGDGKFVMRDGSKVLYQR